MRKVARIFEECNGKYYICDDNDDSEILDARGRGYEFKIDAMRAAYRDGYTHCTGSGTYHPGVRALTTMPGLLTPPGVFAAV